MQPWYSKMKRNSHIWKQVHPVSVSEQVFHKQGTEFGSQGTCQCGTVANNIHKQKPYNGKDLI